VLLEDGRAGKAEQLGVGEELLDRPVVLTELRAVALVEDEDEALGGKRGEALAVVAPVGAVEGEAELLDGGDDHLVGLVLGEQATDKRFGVGVLLDAAFLEAVELLARLAVEVLAIDDEDAFGDLVVFAEQRGGLEGGERLAAAGGVPDVAVAVVSLAAVHEGLDGVDLVRAHHEELLLALDEHHVTADHAAKLAFLQELLGEVVEVRDRFVVAVGPGVDRQELLVGGKVEVPGVVVREIEGLRAVADDEELDEAEERAGVAVARVALVLGDLFHRAARIDAERLQLDLHDRNAVDEQQDVVAVVAVVGVDPELVDDLEVVLAPVLDVDERVGERRAVVAEEVVLFAQADGIPEDVSRDQLVEEAGELGICEGDAVEGFELLPEVALQCGTIADVGAIGVLQLDESLNELAFDILLSDTQWLRTGRLGIRG